MSSKTRPISMAVLLLCLAAFAGTAAWAQDADEAEPRTFDAAASDMQKRLEASLDELAELRRRIADEQIPISRELSSLEAELVEVREQYQQASRVLDNRTLDVSNLRKEIEARQQQSQYLSNLLGEYVRNFDSRLHIAERQRYADQLEAAELAPQNSGLSEREVFATQADLLEASVDRLDEMIGGARFRGTAVDATGTVRPGQFVLVGPVAVFVSNDGQVVGTVERRLGSTEPAVLAFDDPELSEATKQLVAGEGGRLPLDPSLGNANKIEQTEETFLEHAKRGGPVIVPIFILAGASLLVALFKWMGLTLVAKPSGKRVDLVLDSVARGDREQAKRRAAQVRGPVGRMLSEGVAHLDHPPDLIEEIMFEKVLATRLKVQRFLPFIAITAAAAPLLGLLGTVTGIINTFKLITVFGTGDVKTLSGGISEALITTEFGLIVAIPALLLHAFLSRKAKGIVDQMDRTAVALLNQIGKAAGSKPEPQPAAEEEPATAEATA